MGGCTGQSRMCTLPLLNLLSKCGRSLHHRPILRHRRKIAPLAAIVLMNLFLHNTNTSVCIQIMKVKLIDIKNKCYNLKFATKMTKCSLQVVWWSLSYREKNAILHKFSSIHHYDNAFRRVSTFSLPRKTLYTAIIWKSEFCHTCKGWRACGDVHIRGAAMHSRGFRNR